MIKNPIYIIVNPVDPLVNAEVNNKTLAIKKKMYTVAIGGVGDSIAIIIQATKFITIPEASKQNLNGWLLKSFIINFWVELRCFCGIMLFSMDK